MQSVTQANSSVLQAHGDRQLSYEKLRALLTAIQAVPEKHIDKLILSAAAEIGHHDGTIQLSKFMEWLDGTTRRKRVAILGGAFSPVTNAHLLLAAQMVQSGSANEVWLVPSAPKADKPGLTTPTLDRYCMCQLAVNTQFDSDFPIFVSDVEVELPEALPTYDLLCKLREENKGVDFVFAIGSDWLQQGASLAQWTSKNWKWKEGDPEESKQIVTGSKMLEEFEFLIMKRPGYDVPPTPDDPTGLKRFGPRFSWLEMPTGMTYIEGNMSSDEIRSRTRSVSTNMMAGISSQNFFAVEGLVPRAVISYMRRTLERSLLDAAGRPVSPSKGGPGRRRVAVYGGAFDPITNSHLTCAAEIMRSGCADAVWLVPSGPRPDKPNLKTSPLDRFCMARIAVNTAFTVDFPVRVSSIECLSRQNEALATYDMLRKLQSRFESCDFSFVIGSDWLQPNTHLADWTSKNWAWKPGDPEDQKTIVTGQRMLNEFDFIVIKRPGYDVERTADDPTGLKKFGPRLTWMEMPEGMTFMEGNLSSTEIRKRTKVQRRIGLGGTTPQPVISYIHRRQLYM